MFDICHKLLLEEDEYIYLYVRSNIIYIIYLRFKENYILNISTQFKYKRNDILLKKEEKAKNKTS